MTTAIEPVRIIQPLPSHCPECSANFATLIDSLIQPENSEDYSLAMTVVRNCKSCKHYISAFVLGEKKFKNLLSRKGDRDVRKC